MVSYKCNNCGKLFNKKFDMDRHINAKNKCRKNNEKNVNNNQPKRFICLACEKIFGRKDSLIRHEKVCEIKTEHNIINKNENINTENNYGNQFFGNINGNVIMNNYNLFTFGKDGIDCLTTPEKIAIFFSDENPMEMIIVKVNLDSKKKNHHNVGYTDQHSGYGIIFDGNKWLTERIDIILQILFESKEKDLLKIYDEIKDFLSDDLNGTIRNKLNDLSKAIEPRNKIDLDAKRNLIAHLKKHLYNNRNLALDAKLNTDIEIIQIKKPNMYDGILKDGISISDIDKSIRMKKKLSKKLDLRKEMALDLLNKLDSNKIDKTQYVLLVKMINNNSDMEIINVINRLLYTIILQ